jgi:hypothetical protein
MFLNRSPRVPRSSFRPRLTPEAAYALLYEFQVYDQFDQIIRGSRIYVDESIKNICSNYPILNFIIGFETGDALTNDQGAWEDRLAMRYFPFFPTDFVRKDQQEIFAAGWHVGTYCQTHTSRTAASEPGACGMCQ